MKKFLLIVAAAISLISCTPTTNSSDFKAKGEQLAKQLEESCEKQDAEAVLALDKTIHELEDSIAALGDTAAIADFRNALKDARVRAANYVATVKLEKGAISDAVVKESLDDAMGGSVSVGAVTSSIDATLEKEKH